MLPTTAEGWEALTEAELKKLNPSADAIRDVIRDQFGLGSKCYFMNKEQSIEYIFNPDNRPAILKACEDKYTERQRIASTLRTGGKLEDRVKEAAQGHNYRFESVSRPTGGYTDPFSGRKGKVAYIIEDIDDGARLPIQKQTAQILEEMGILAGFDSRVRYKKAKPAHEAGFATLEDMLGGDSEHVPHLTSAVVLDFAEEQTAPDDGIEKTEIEGDTVTGDEEPEPKKKEANAETELDELDDILNNIDF